MLFFFLEITFLHFYSTYIILTVMPPSTVKFCPVMKPAKGRQQKLMRITPRRSKRDSEWRWRKAEGELKKFNGVPDSALLAKNITALLISEGTPTRPT